MDPPPPLGLIIGAAFISAGIALQLAGTASIMMVLALHMGGLLSLASYGLRYVAFGGSADRPSIRLKIRMSPMDISWFATFFVLNLLFWGNQMGARTVETHWALGTVMVVMAASAIFGVPRESVVSLSAGKLVHRAANAYGWVHERIIGLGNTV